MAMMMQSTTSPTVTKRAFRVRSVESALWAGSIVAILGMAVFLPFAWDASRYLAALASYPSYILGEGGVSLPYSPLAMIPTMTITRSLPHWLLIVLFSMLYVAGWMAITWAGVQLANGRERKLVRCAAPVLAFFPGLLVTDVIVSGNIAYILYGMMLTAVVYGWRSGRWRWFYLAVLVASCFKAQMVTMLAIPLLCGRRAWRPTLVTGAGVLGLYYLQSRIWPGPFRIYLNSLRQLTHSSTDLGYGMVGNLARLFPVWNQVVSVALYAIYALALFAMLLWLAGLYRQGRIRFASWVPVMLLGVLLLNPRIVSYDAAAFTLPMLLVGLRALRDRNGELRRRALMLAGTVLLVANVLVEINEDVVTVWPDLWNYVEMCVLLTVFGFGVRGLLKEAGSEPAIALSEQSAN